MNSLINRTALEHEIIKGLEIEVESLESEGKGAGEMISFRYKDVAASGVVGNLGIPLERIHEHKMPYASECSPLIEKENEKARGVFIVKPFCDLSIIANKGSFTSMLGIGTDVQKVKGTLLRAINSFDFEPQQINPDFVESAHNFLSIDAVGAYDVCLEQAKKIKARAPTLYAAYRYALFLENCLGKTREEVGRIIGKTYKVSIGF